MQNARCERLESNFHLKKAERVIRFLLAGENYADGTQHILRIAGAGDGHGIWAMADSAAWLLAGWLSVVDVAGGVAAGGGALGFVLVHPGFCRAGTWDFGADGSAAGTGGVRVVSACAKP